MEREIEVVHISRSGEPGNRATAAVHMRCCR